MITSDKGIGLIKEFEGCRLSAYRCPAGVWTIGYGHTLNVKPGDVITQKQADEYLREDLKKFESHVSSYNKYGWTQNEFDALVSFAFNIGNITGLTAAGTRSKAQIADAMLLYVRAKGIVLPGLITRRQKEHDLFVTSGAKKSNNEIALEVVNGLWKNGRERTKLLKDAGYDPKEIQKLVNKLMKA